VVPVLDAALDGRLVLADVEGAEAEGQEGGIVLGPERRGRKAHEERGGKPPQQSDQSPLPPERRRRSIREFGGRSNPPARVYLIDMRAALSLLLLLLVGWPAQALEGLTRGGAGVVREIVD